MGETVDSLNIEVQASAVKANDALDKLIGKLDRLSTSLSQINGHNLVSLSSGVNRLSSAMQGMNDASTEEDFTRLTNNISKIGAIDSESVKNAAASIHQITNAFNELGGVSVSGGAAQFGEIASGIKQLGYVSSTKAIENIPKLADAMKQLMTTLSGAPRVSQNLIDMTNALARLSRTGASSGRAANSLTASLNTYTKSTSRATIGTRSLASALGKLCAGYWVIFRVFGKIGDAIDISSDLTEVQNVIDVTFGQYKNLIEEMASTSVIDYGMSELTAKQMAGRFQAMGTAMGFAHGQMAGMSVELTKLAADMASFYNEEQADVAKSLQAVFTGETEPLRKYGLDLTQATLKEWAMKQGLDADIQSMSQAEKTMLRYQYVMANTAAAQGDFARTADTWANQVRILQQSFQALGSIIGGVTINALKPLVKALNAAMSHVIAFAKTISNALGKIFGWKYEEGGGGIANDLETGAGAADDIANGVGNAADKAKKLKQQLQGFDELNVLTSDSDSSSGSGGGSGSGGASGGGADGGQWVEQDSILKQFESDIDSLYELGEYIGKTLTDAMNSIDWESVYQGARNFGTGLADFLNGLISPELFGATGRTIAGALNTAIYAALSFGETFDWEDLGDSIAAGINEFFEMFDFAALARSWNTWAQGILDAAIRAIEKTNWGMIGKRIGIFLANLDFVEYGKKVGKLIWDAINAGVDFFKSSFKEAPFETLILSITGIYNALKLFNASKIVLGIKKIYNALMPLKSYLSLFRSELSSGKTALDALDISIDAVRSNMTLATKALIGIGAAIGELAFVSDAFEGMCSGTQSLASGIMQVSAAVGVAGAALYVVLGPAGIIVSALTAIAGAIIGINKAWDEKIASDYEEFQDHIASNSDKLKESSDALNDLSESTNDYIENANAQAESLGALADSYFTLADKATLTSSEQQQLSNITRELIDQVPLLKGVIDGVTNSYGSQREEVEKLITAQQEQLNASAYASIVSDYTNELAKANIQLEIAQQDYDKNADSLEAYYSIMDDWDGYEDINLWFERNSDAISKIGISTDNATEAWQKLEQQSGFLEDAQTELSSSLKETQETYDKANEELDTANRLYNESIDAMNEATRSSATYQQALRDLSYEFDNLGISISDSLMDTLVMNGYDSSGLKEFFDSMKSGAQASSAELQQIFSDLGLSLPDSISSSLEMKSPDVQSETVKLLLSMESGVQLKESDLSTLFANLGLNLPDELSKSLAEKETSVQTSTVNLLSKLDEGQALVKDNLIQVFSNLGIEVTDDGLIQALSDEEADTQQAAIELLLQLKNASDEEQSYLTNELKSLGIGVSKDGYIYGIDSQQRNAKTSGSNLVNSSTQGVSAAVSSCNVFLLGSSFGEGYAQGIMSQIRAVATAGAQLVAAGAKSVQTTQQSHSPSKVTRKLGGYFSEGYNLGIEDNVDSTWKIAENWISGIVDRVSRFSMPSLDIQINRPEIPSLATTDLRELVNSGSYSADIRSNVSTEIGVSMNTYIGEVRKQNALLEEQNRLLREIYDKPVIQDSDVFSSWRREQGHFFGKTGRTGVLGID